MPSSPSSHLPGNRSREMPILPWIKASPGLSPLRNLYLTPASGEPRGATQMPSVVSPLIVFISRGGQRRLLGTPAAAAAESAKGNGHKAHSLDSCCPNQAGPHSGHQRSAIRPRAFGPAVPFAVPPPLALPRLSRAPVAPLRVPAGGSRGGRLPLGAAGPAVTAVFLLPARVRRRGCI